MSEHLLKTDDPIPTTFETELIYRSDASRTARQREAIANIDVLWSRRGLLLKLLVGGWLLSMIFSLLIPPRYNSTVKLMPPDQTASGLAQLASMAGRANGTGVLAGLAGDLLGQRTSGDLFVGVLQSRTVAMALATKFDLRKVYSAKRWEDALRILDQRTDIKQDRKSGIITVVVSDRSRARAAQMAQEYVNQLDLVMTQLNTSSAHRERVFLEQRLEQVQQNLEVAERDFSQFASKNVAVDIPEQGKAMVEAASTLEGQLIAAQTELQGLREIYADQNVRVRAMEARIEELQRQLQKLGGKESSSTNQSLDPSSLYPTIRRLPILGVQYADLLRNTKVQEAVFEALTQEYELAKVAEAKEIPSVKVLDPPNVAERKAFPPRRMITIFGGLLIFAAGAAWVIAKQRWERTDPRDLRKSFVLKVSNELRQDLRWLSRYGRGRSIAASEARQGDDAIPEVEKG